MMINKRKLNKIVLILILSCYISKTAAKSAIESASLDTVPLKNISLSLAQTLNTTTYEELGINFIEQIYKSFKYTPILKSVDKILKKFANKLESKFNETFLMLNQIRDTVEKYKLLHLNIHSALVPCENATETEDDLLTDYVNINRVLFNSMELAKKTKSTIKQTYYLSTDDVLNNSYTCHFDCNVNQLILWKSYLTQIHEAPKNILLLFSNTALMSDHSFKLIKLFTKHLLTLLNDEDKVGIIVFSDNWCSPSNSDQCFFANQGLYLKNLLPITNATDQNKNILHRFVDALQRKNGTTNYTLGFQQAFEAIKNSNISQHEEVMLLYLDHALSLKSEVKSVLQLIAKSLPNFQNKIIINICAILEDVIVENMNYLNDVSSQNYNKYNVPHFKDTKKGVTIPLFKSKDIGLTIIRLIKTLSVSQKSVPKLQVSLPTWDFQNKDLTISVTIPCGNDENYSIAGTDLYFSSIVEDITYFNNYPEYFYAFMIDTKGTTLMHPSYPRPLAVFKQIKFIDIIHLEKYSKFGAVRAMLLSAEEGTYVLQPQRLRYTWKRVLNAYVICIVTKEEHEMPSRPFKVRFPVNKLISHRLDLVPPSSQCRHLNQVATLDAGSLYLSASSFQSPHAYAHSSPTSSASIQRYMAYFKDSTNLISKPDLREEVRDDVAALAQVLNFLQNQHLSGARAMYAVRRYVAAPSGVLQLYPASSLAPDFEPTRRNWYLTATATENRLRKTVLTPPYLDEGGAGYIVTIAFATAHLVAGMDVTYGFVHKLLLEHMPFCGENGVKCFLMDDRGYLVYHQNLVDPNGHGPIEQQHIIHKESLVANDILNRNNVLRKTVCNNYADGTTQRFYKLLLNESGVVESAVHGEQCIKYQIASVPGTNLFLGVVNATCEVFATFCPCSVVDRFCLNCNRMEPRECECPCECPLNFDAKTRSNYTENALCSPTPEQAQRVTNNLQPTKELKSCFPTVCEQQTAFKSCLGVIGCEWCQYDVDGESLLANPFCSPILTCFNGILGSPTPYGDSAKSYSTITDDFFQSSYSPIGAVIGSIIGIGLVLVLLFFCYRCHNSSANDRFYFASTQENQVQMSDRNNSDDYHEVDNQQNKLLQGSKKAEPISPYYVSSSYRRPVTATDSDYGYSTMTPHDESEHLSLAPLEIDSLEDDTSDAVSINTSVSSKVSKFPLKNKQIVPNSFTNLKDRNCVIASVTVHRNMDTVE